MNSANDAINANSENNSNSANNAHKSSNMLNFSTPQHGLAPLVNVKIDEGVKSSTFF